MNSACTFFVQPIRMRAAFDEAAASAAAGSRPKPGARQKTSSFQQASAP
jgi:hypothetical protein